MNLLRRTFLLDATLPLLVLFALLLTSTASAWGEETNSKAVRIGTYDSRAIAIAYAASDFNPVAEKMREYERAKADGDEDRARELEEWGERHQRNLHRQGFSLVPVNDLLSHVRQELAGVAKKADVIAITRACDFTSGSVEVVDVTEQLVDLFNPSEKTLAHVRGIQGQPAVDLDELVRDRK